MRGNSSKILHSIPDTTGLCNSLASDFRNIFCKLTLTEDHRILIILSDTSPLNYLILIGEAEILPQMFSEVIVPPGVVHELTHPETPENVRRWIESPPGWLKVRKPHEVSSDLQLGAGESEAISLGIELRADLLLMDDRLARKAAESHGLNVVGTLGVLEAAANQGLLDLARSFEQLRETTFHVSPAVLEQILEAHRRRFDQP